MGYRAHRDTRGPSECVHRATAGGPEKAWAGHARSDGLWRAPFAPARGTGTQAGRTNRLQPRHASPGLAEHQRRQSCGGPSPRGRPPLASANFCRQKHRWPACKRDRVREIGVRREFSQVRDRVLTPRTGRSPLRLPLRIGDRFCNLEFFAKARDRTYEMPATHIEICPLCSMFLWAMGGPLGRASCNCSHTFTHHTVTLITP